MNVRKETQHFVCCIDTRRVVIGAFVRSRAAVTLVDIASAPLAGIDPASVKKSCAAVFSALSYNHQPITLLLPTSFATCRFVKVPATSDDEIGKIASLQAHRFLPASMGDLVIGFQVLSKKDGFAEINLVMMPKTIIEQYVEIFTAYEPDSITVTTHAFGIFNFFSHNRLLPREPVYAVEIYQDTVECAIASAKGLFVGRSCTIPNNAQGMEETLTAEIRKVNDTYLKEIRGVVPQKGLAVGFENPPAQEAIKNITGAAIETIDVWKYIRAPQQIVNKTNGHGYPLAAIAGVGCTSIVATLELRTDEQKKVRGARIERRHIRQSIVYTCLAALFFLIAAVVDLRNKQTYIHAVKDELRRIEMQEKGIERIGSLASFMPRAAGRFPSVLKVLSESFRVRPETITLDDFIYDAESGEITFKGQARELSDVVTFVSHIESSSLFKEFETKINYASAQPGREDDGTLFEIRCAKRK